MRLVRWSRARIVEVPNVVLVSALRRALRARFHAFAGSLLDRRRAFPLRGKVLGAWLRTRDRGFVAEKSLPFGGRLVCRFATPYEAMIWRGEEEDGELDVLARLLSPGEAFADCGANVGLWSITAAKLVGDRGTVFAIEPNPETVRHLEANLTLSRVANVRVSVCAVGAAPALARFEAGEFSNLGRLSAEGSASVPVRPLDEILGARPIAGLKIDVEGSEAAVLLGATAILERDAPWVFIEFNRAYATSDRLADWEPHAILAARGYSPFRLPPPRSDARFGAAIDPMQFRTRRYVNVLYAKRPFELAR
ncbi:MAG: FkbM family methyltransferase [Candidatus Baltobacteraceae bacterium]